MTSKLRKEWAKWEREVEILKFYALAKRYGFYDPSCRLGYSKKFIDKIRKIAGPNPIA